MVVGWLAAALRRRRWRARMRVADAARDTGDYGRAAQLYGAITRDFPERRAAWVQLGNMAKDSGDFASAGKAYLHARKLDESDADVSLQLGHLSKLQGNFVEAISWYEESVALNPDGLAAEELIALGFRRRVQDLRDVGEAAHLLDLPGRALLTHQRLAVAFANRRV